MHRRTDATDRAYQTVYTSFVCLTFSTRVAGVIFALVAVSHALRIYMEWPVTIANWSVPKSVSWIALIVLVDSLFSRLGSSQRKASTETRKEDHSASGVSPPTMSAHTYWLLAWRDCGFWNPTPAALVRTACRQCLAKVLACPGAAA
jgi:hypothetical protein